MYRVLRNIHTGGGRVIRAGTINNLDALQPDVIDLFLEKGIITPVKTPPLSELPNFTSQATKLEKAGVGTVAELLDSDPVTVAEAVGVRPATVKKWQDIAKGWLTN